MLSESWNVVVTDAYQGEVSTTHRVTPLYIPWFRKKSTTSDSTFNIVCLWQPL